MLHYAFWNVSRCFNVGDGIGIMLHYARALSFESAPTVSHLVWATAYVTNAILHCTALRDTDIDERTLERYSEKQSPARLTLTPTGRVLGTE